MKEMTLGAPPDAFSDLERRKEIMDGNIRLDMEEGINVMQECIFYPPIKQGYASSICGKACDMACYIHLEETGKLTRGFTKPFRRRAEWFLDDIYE